MKYLLTVLGLLILIGFVGQIIRYSGISQFGIMTMLAGAVGRIGAILVIIGNGTLKKERILFPLISLAVSITIIGALFKITHAPKADLLISTGLYGIALVYGIRFLKKANKNMLDVLKVLWAITMSMAILFAIQHFNFGSELKIIETVFFLFLFAVFVYNYRTKILLEDDSVNASN